MKIISSPDRWPSARPSSSDCTLYTALIMVVTINAFRRHRHLIITSLIIVFNIINHTRHHVVKDDQVSPTCADYRFQKNSYSGNNRKHKYLGPALWAMC